MKNNFHMRLGVSSFTLDGLGAGGEGDDRGWDGWMASLTRWTRVWWTPGVGEWQGGLACCKSWGHKESDTTEWLSWTGASLVAETVKNLPVGQEMKEIWVWTLVRKIPWRRKWQTTLLLLPGKSHGQRSLVGYNPWGLKESDTSEWLKLTLHFCVSL